MDAISTGKKEKENGTAIETGAGRVIRAALCQGPHSEIDLGAL